ncbi:MAG: hypothetical protein KKC96_03385 [Nanoarchaeota archaeon]|nr:hypothetical protein [Nanoarchaeota archaeon]MBU2458893.1 hypothetical protein [Nanoarchaeota archaeon]
MVCKYEENCKMKKQSHEGRWGLNDWYVEQRCYGDESIKCPCYAILEGMDFSLKFSKGLQKLTTEFR